MQVLRRTPLLKAAYQSLARRVKRCDVYLYAYMSTSLTLKHTTV